MKRSEIDGAVARAIATAKKFSVALPKWAEWSPDKFDNDAGGMRAQGLGWKVVDFGLGDFDHCGLVILAVCCPIVDESGEPAGAASQIGGKEYPATAFSRKYLFVKAGQTEPHHFHRQKARKEVTVVAGGTVRFELAWAENDKVLSDRNVDVQIDGIWYALPAHGSIIVGPGETITLPGDLSHIIAVPAEGEDVVMLETSTANNDRTDNIFPFITPSSAPIEEDVKPRYQMLDEHKRAGSKA